MEQVQTMAANQHAANDQTHDTPLMYPFAEQRGDGDHSHQRQKGRCRYMQEGFGHTLSRSLDSKVR